MVVVVAAADKQTGKQVGSSGKNVCHVLSAGRGRRRRDGLAVVVAAASVSVFVVAIGLTLALALIALTPLS